MFNDITNADPHRQPQGKVHACGCVPYFPSSEEILSIKLMQAGTSQPSLLHTGEMSSTYTRSCRVDNHQIDHEYHGVKGNISDTELQSVLLRIWQTMCIRKKNLYAACPYLIDPVKKSDCNPRPFSKCSSFSCV